MLHRDISLLRRARWDCVNDIVCKLEYCSKRASDTEVGARFNIFQFLALWPSSSSFLMHLQNGSFPSLWFGLLLQEISNQSHRLICHVKFRKLLRPWCGDTMASVFSTSKVLGSLVIAMLVSRGQLHYEDLV